SIHFLVEAVTKDELTDPVQKVIEFSQKDKRVILLKIADRLDNMNDNIENMGIKTKSKYIKQNQQLLEFMQSIDEMYFYDKLKNLTNKLANLVGSDLSA
ncbi:MAG: hypothetical protein OEZ01_06175, partial [Candidatus Heimdallarchaeota archaeon]|nr:hypothetical protein [Candidatus Heimdallarchaeota archaeon]